VKMNEQEDDNASWAKLESKASDILGLGLRLGLGLSRKMTISTGLS
jgi:hypothetical protein